MDTHDSFIQVWEAVGQGDMGCTAGGGRDSMGVFSDAGLVFYSSTGGYNNSGSGASHTAMCRFILVYTCYIFIFMSKYVAQWSCKACHFIPLYVPTCS